MTLRAETTVEYHFNDPYIFFCKHHSTLGISESHGDSVQLNGLDEDCINEFIKTYFEYVLDDAPMVEYFKERLDRAKEYHMDAAFKKAEEEV